MPLSFPQIPKSLPAPHAQFTDTCVAFKAFDANMQCHGGFQYAVGETYVHTQPQAATCSHGFHACLEPFDVLSYFDARFAIVTISGLCTSEHGDTKVAACVITIEREVTRGELTDLQVAYCAERGIGNVSSGGYSKASSSGDNSKASSSGNYSKASSSGYNSTASSSGDDSTASSSGDYSKASSSRDYSTASSSGYNSKSSSSGYNSKASSSGDNSKASSSGNNSKASSSGDYCKASCDTNGFACVSGVEGYVKGNVGSALSLGYRDDTGRNRIAVAYVGENGIEPDTWYKIDGDTGRIIKA